jgi:hypothetical protein
MKFVFVTEVIVKVGWIGGVKMRVSENVAVTKYCPVGSTKGRFVLGSYGPTNGLSGKA